MVNLAKRPQRRRCLIPRHETYAADLYHTDHFAFREGWKALIRNHHVWTWVLFLGLGLGQVTAQAAALKPLPDTGVNLSGGEFYDPTKTPNPVYGKDFVYPSPAEFSYFSRQGMNIFRVPFLWETLQPTAMGPLQQDQVARLKDAVNAATKQGLTVILDPHNYARYYGKVIGGPDVPNAAFADFWGKLASVFGSDKHIWFGLMNEPHDMPTVQWLSAANAAIAAIRQAGAHNKILVPGNAWTGAGSWTDTWYGGGANSVVMLGVRDPDHNFAFEVHQYLDANSSGTSTDVVSSTIGSERLRAVTNWCKAHHFQAFLGEFAVPNTPTGQAALTDMLTNMEQNRDVWLGFTWWAAGAWWGNYMFSLEPQNGQDRPQMAWLRPFLH